MQIPPGIQQLLSNTRYGSINLSVYKWRHSSLHLIALRVRSTGDTGVHRLVGPDDGVWRAAFAHSSPVDHVVSWRAGDAGGAELGGIDSTAPTLRGHASDDVGDVDGVDPRHVATVFSPLGGI